MQIKIIFFLSKKVERKEVFEVRNTIIHDKIFRCLFHIHLHCTMYIFFKNISKIYYIFLLNAAFYLTNTSTIIVMGGAAVFTITKSNQIYTKY